MGKKKSQRLNKKWILTAVTGIFAGGACIGIATWALKARSPSLFCEGMDRKDGTHKIFRAFPLESGQVHAQIFKKTASGKEELIFEDQKAGADIQATEGLLSLRASDTQQIRIHRSCGKSSVCRMENVISPTPDELRKLQDRLADLNVKSLAVQKTASKKKTSKKAPSRLLEIQREIGVVEEKLRNRGVKIEAIPLKALPSASWCP